MSGCGLNTPKKVAVLGGRVHYITLPICADGMNLSEPHTSILACYAH